MKKISRKHIFVAVFLTIPSAIITFGTATSWAAPNLDGRKATQPGQVERLYRGCALMVTIGDVKTALGIDFD